VGFRILVRVGIGIGGFDIVLWGNLGGFVVLWGMLEVVLLADIGVNGLMAVIQELRVGCCAA
jgi:hypothetical protein